MLARWAGWLRPGGWLAVQVPGNFRAPTHALLAELCRSPRWAARLRRRRAPPDAVLEPAGYFDVLTAAGLSADVWETTYLHVLHRTGSGADLGAAAPCCRPVLAGSRRRRRRRVHRRVRRRAARRAYPARPDGTTLLPFRRVFAVGSRPS